jgi:transposase
MFYSGIDLHRDNSMITTVACSGAIVNQQKLPNDELSILDYFFSMGKEHRAVVEATANWYWLSDLLNDHGIELVLAHAKYLKAISYAKVKTDKVDSQTLANLLRIDMVPAAHQIAPSLRGLRDLMRARLRLVTKNSSCQNSIHRLLGKYNLNIPGDKKLHDLSTLETLHGLPLPKEALLQLEFHKQKIRLLHRQIKELEKSLHPQLIPNSDIQRFLWIPGIGKILAFTIYLEIDGITCFPTVKNFHSYCRLVPGADNSNRKVKHKSANKDGNRYLKMAFTEAAVRVVQYYKEIKTFYQSRERRKHKAIAKTLVAQELAKTCYFVLATKTDYNNTFKRKNFKQTKIYAMAIPIHREQALKPNCFGL